MSELVQMLDKPSGALGKTGRRSQHGFDAMQEVLELIEFPRGGEAGGADDDDEEVNVEKMLRQLNSLDFRLQMHAQNSGSQLQRSTDEVIKAIKEVQVGSEAQANLEELQFGTELSADDEVLAGLRREMIELLSVERRIKECQHMGREIEEFETRIQKVEEYIRSDDLVMLCQLVVGQLQGRMKLVRDMGKGSTGAQAKERKGRAAHKMSDADEDGNQQVFRQHQQSRLQRFDKLILTYVQYKQNEILKQDGSNQSKGSAQTAAAKGAEAAASGDQACKQNYCTSINAILQLFSVFSVEQMNNFVSEKLIKEKLFKEFNASINAAKDHDVRSFVADCLDEETMEQADRIYELARFTCKFYATLQAFVVRNNPFIESIYDKMNREHVARFWRQFFAQVYQEYGERLDAELNPPKQKSVPVAKEEDGGACQLQLVIFERIIVGSLERVLDVTFSGNRHDKKGMQEAFAPIFRHLFEQLIESALQRVNKQVLPAQCDLILASFQKYVDSHNTQNEGSYSKDSLSQLALFFQEQMRKLEDVVKRQCLPLLVGMCQGYGLMEFLNETLIAQYLHKLTSQLTFLFNQLCSKRICYQLASLQSVQDLLSIEKTTQLSSSFQMQNAGHGAPSQMLSAAAVLGSASDLALHLKSKFQWQNVFDLMKLHTVFRVSFGRDRLQSESLKECVNRLVERYIRAREGSSGDGVMSMLRAYISDVSCLRKEMRGEKEAAKAPYQEVLEALITDGVSAGGRAEDRFPEPGKPASLEIGDEEALRLVISPILSASHLLQCLHANICKTFIMPIYTEIVSIHKIGAWRETHRLKLADAEDRFNIQNEGPETVQPKEASQAPAQSASAGTASGLVGGLSSFFVQNVSGLTQKGKTGAPTAAPMSSQKKCSSTIKPPPPSEYARNIGDHFISFIQQLDQFFDYEQQQQEQKALEAEQQNKEAPRPILSLEEAERENFGMLYISMLAIKLIELISRKYCQIQSLGGLVRPRQIAPETLGQLERNDQVTYEYLSSSDCAQAGALQLIKDIDYIKKTFRQFCINSPDEQQLLFFSAQHGALTDQDGVILSKRSFKSLNSIQLACALHPILLAREMLQLIRSEQSADSQQAAKLSPEFLELLECSTYRQIIGHFRQVSSASFQGAKSLLSLDSFEQNPLKKIALAYVGQINDLKDVLAGLTQVVQLAEPSGQQQMAAPVTDLGLVDEVVGKVITVLGP